MSVPLYASMADAAKVLLRDAIGREVVALLNTQKQAASFADAAGGGLGNPIVVLEGMDGTGKSTLAGNLAKELGAELLRTPPESLRPFRAHFDAQGEELRRAYYMAGNYACAMEAAKLAATGPVVIDRFWPSTAAYAIASACDTTPQILKQPDILQMPRDLVDLIPAGYPLVGILLELDEQLRSRRVRERAAGPPQAAVPVTGEEEALERDRAFRERVLFAYRALRLDGEALRVLDAAGTEQEVLQRALELVRGECEEAKRLIPVSVNWHYTRVCNYQCKFCFHTAKNSFFLPRDDEGMAEAKRCLLRLKQAGMKKINFSGGEPFLHPKELGELCRFCKKDLCLESVSIISNGSKITESWVREYASWVDILAISCDSFNEETNKKVGRGTGMHIAQLKQVATWCRQHKVLFKLNSVINIHNVDEDMNAAIAELGPVRWKVFQCLILAGENAGEGALRDARELVITEEQFKAFLDRHKSLKCLVPEDNSKMKDSYLILDEHMCFLNCTDGSKTPGKSLRDVSVTGAMRGAGFDAHMFELRGGRYDWSRQDMEDIARTPTPSRPSSGLSRSPTRRQAQAHPKAHALGGAKLLSPWDGGAAGAAAAAVAAAVVVVAGVTVAAQLFRPRHAARV